jgi:hypothetical protein
MTQTISSIIALAVAVVASLSTTPFADRLSEPQDIPFCNYNDPVLMDAPVEGGHMVFTCRNSYHWPRPPGYIESGSCSYWFCDSASSCGQDEWTKRTRTRKYYACIVQPPTGPSIISGPALDVPTGDCCKCNMPDPQPIWQPD